MQVTQVQCLRPQYRCHSQHHQSTPLNQTGCLFACCPREWKVGAHCWGVYWLSSGFLDLLAVVLDWLKWRVICAGIADNNRWQSWVQVERYTDRLIPALPPDRSHQEPNRLLDVQQDEHPALAYHRPVKFPSPGPRSSIAESVWQFERNVLAQLDPIDQQIR